MTHQIVPSDPWRVRIAMTFALVCALAAQPAMAQTRTPCSRADLSSYLTYPLKAARCGLEGTVAVRFDVAADGRAVNAVIVSSSHRIFNRQVIDGVGRLQCSPSWAGRRIELEVEFKLVDGAVSKDGAHACIDDKPLAPADPGGS